MPAAIPLRRDFDAPGLWRLLALAAVYDAMNRSEAARIGGMDRQTLRNWDEGGRTAASAERCSDGETAQIIETGPDRETDSVIPWRRIDLVRIIDQRFGVAYSQSAISDYLTEPGFSRISGRPQHPAQEPQVIEAFKKLRQHADGAHG